MMTTPERLRRRQLREGVVLIVLGVFMTASTLYFEWQDREQQGRDQAQEECFQKNFTELSKVLDLRANLGRQETDVRLKVSSAEQEIWQVYAEAAGLVRDDPTKPLKRADRERLQRKLVSKLLDYQETANEVKSEIRQIQLERRRHPVPPYPVGSCDG